jgi:hypothetical protein
MTRVGVVLAAGLALTAVAVVVTLSRSPLTLAGANSVQTVVRLSETTSREDAEGCQADETLPRDIAAVHLSMFAVVGPRVTVRMLSGSRVITSGTEAPGWVGSVATVPLRPLPRAYSHVKLCFKISSVNGPVQVNGAHTSRAEAVVSRGEVLPGRMRVEYLRPGRRSWWSLAGGVVQRMGLGHAAGGVFGVALVALLAAAVLTLSTLAAARGLR